MKDSVNPSLFFGGMLLCTGLSFAQSAKVPACHIPPGNLAQAKTLQEGAAALHAHLAHGDFAGDGRAGQSAGTVIKFQQGLQNNGTSVAAYRFNPNQALGTPDCNNQPGQFASLGFLHHSGNETLKLDLSAAEENNILTIRISDLQGRILQETKLLTDSRQTDLTMDCRGLPQGQLILTMEGAGLNETRRIFND